jgi:hypothetical protein
MSASRFPLVMPVTSTTLAAWREDELASFEDHDGAPDHPHAILGRRATRLVIRDEHELERLIASAHNAAACWDDRHAYRAAMARLAARLHELVQWPAA